MEQWSNGAITLTFSNPAEKLKTSKGSDEASATHLLLPLARAGLIGVRARCVCFHLSCPLLPAPRFPTLGKYRREQSSKMTPSARCVSPHWRRPERPGGHPSCATH